MDLRPLVAEKFGTLERCYGHCEQQPTLRFLNSADTPVIGGYACHAGYLSRIVVYAESISINEARGLVQALVGPATAITDEDIRVENMYPWDLDMRGEAGKILMAAYWTQNYRRSKNEDPNRTGLFLCGSCQSIFPQPIVERRALCDRCRASRISNA